MREETMLLFAAIVIAVLAAVVLYQRFAFRRGIQKELHGISEKLREITETGSDEKVMVFTDEPVLMELAGQVNRLLTERQKIKADVRREQISSKKMLSNISHDIKTPLTVILGYLEMMRLRGGDDDMLEKVEEKARQVVDLINQFFTLAKLESGDTDVSLSKLDLCEQCRENVLSFYEILLQREFEVALSIPKTPVYVQGNADALQRIFSNLISNVMRYGADGKYLGVFVREERDGVYVDVVDRGKGIGPEFAASVFDRLYTMEDSRNREIQGNGLGLTIAKNLAERMGGGISLESEPHVRTAFTVRLKKYPVSLAPGIENERNL